MLAKYSIFVLYPTPLISIKVLDKEGAAVDNVFCPAPKLMGIPDVKSKVSLVIWI